MLQMALYCCVLTTVSGDSAAKRCISAGSWRQSPGLVPPRVSRSGQYNDKNWEDCMKSLISAALGAGLAVAMCAAPAGAADLPMVTKAPVAAPVFSWTGCYLGVNLGYGWGRASESITGGGVTGSASANLNGVLGGGQIGCNYQWNSIVWGIEGDFQGTGQRRTDSTSIAGVGINITNSVPWFGTIRGRV